MIAVTSPLGLAITAGACWRLVKLATSDAILDKTAEMDAQMAQRLPVRYLSLVPRGVDRRRRRRTRRALLVLVGLGRLRARLICRGRLHD